MALISNSRLCDRKLILTDAWQRDRTGACMAAILHCLMYDTNPVLAHMHGIERAHTHLCMPLSLHSRVHCVYPVLANVYGINLAIE